MANEALRIGSYFILQFKNFLGELFPILFLHHLFSVLYCLILLVLLLYKFGLFFGQNLWSKHANEAKLGLRVWSSDYSSFMNLTLKHVLPVDAMFESVIDDPAEDIVAGVRPPLSILDSLENGATPDSVLLNTIFICALSVRRLVLRQSLGCYVDIVVHCCILQEVILIKWLEHARVTHEELQCVRQLYTQ